MNKCKEQKHCHHDPACTPDIAIGHKKTKELREKMYSLCIESEDRDMVCHYEVNDEILDSFAGLILDEVEKGIKESGLVYVRIAKVIDNLRGSDE